MSKTTDIDDIIVTHHNDLMFDILWDDVVLVGRIRSKLDKLSVSNIVIYRKHFCGDI